jgi:tetratricopeptide (TPR) repeat protein
MLKELEEMFDNAYVYFNAGNLEKCICACDKLIKKGYNAYDLRANCFYELQMYEKAASDYSIIIDMDKANILAYIQRGICYNCINDFDNAVKDFSFVISQFGEDGEVPEKCSLYAKLDTDLLIEAYRLRAVANYYMQKHSESLRDCEKCLQLMEKYGVNDALNKASIHLTKGNILRGMMQWEYAEEEYTKVLSYDNKQPEAYYFRFMVRHMLENSLGGLDDLKKCVKFADINSEIYQQAFSLLKGINKRMKKRK